MCFDANMRGATEGIPFFCEVQGLTSKSELYKSGIREGDIIICERTSAPENKVTALAKLQDRQILVFDETDFRVEWLVYQKRVVTWFNCLAQQNKE